MDTSKVGKESTIIVSKVTVITEQKKVKVCTKFTLPRGDNVFMAMKMAEVFLEKTQGLCGSK